MYGSVNDTDNLDKNIHFLIYYVEHHIITRGSWVFTWDSPPWVVCNSLLCPARPPESGRHQSLWPTSGTGKEQ